jgi:hypothetical protein
VKGGGASRRGALLPEQGDDASQSGKERDGQHNPDAAVVCLGTRVRCGRVVAVGRGMIEMVRGLGHVVERTHPFERFDGVPVLVYGRAGALRDHEGKCVCTVIRGRGPLLRELELVMPGGTRVRPLAGSRCPAMTAKNDGAATARWANRTCARCR